MKNLIYLISLFLLITLSTNAQELTNWQVGINANPFLFTKFNNPLFDNSSYFKQDKQDFPNGFGFGLTIEKNWNDRWGFKTGYEITTQNEKYFVDDSSADNIHVTTSFKYHKIPLTIQYYLPIKDKLYLTFNQGIQLSVLKRFKTVLAGDFQKITSSSEYGESIFYNNPENNNSVRGNFNDIFHNKTLFGIIGSFGLKGFLSDKFSYSANLRYEYDFTNPDKLQYYSNPKKDLHNFRIGLEFGLQYNFSLNHVRFDKTPHEI
jgi:hypothetical protein